ncbi:hypothetical protein LLG95_06215 [bacterium]|nr:hypothetical protein [bacterium]
MEWNQIIRDNERWLSTYCALARFTGWMLVFFGILFFFGNVFARIYHPEVFAQSPFFPGALIQPFTAALLPGLIALVVGAFLQYLIKPDARLGLLLVHGDKVLYLAAAVYLLRIVEMLTNMPMVYTHFNDIWDGLRAIGFVISPNLLLPIAQILIAVGLAQGLRRVLSAIRDSKTLI